MASKRKPYTKPAVIFEKALEPLAMECDPYPQTDPGTLKADLGQCAFLMS